MAPIGKDMPQVRTKPAALGRAEALSNRAGEMIRRPRQAMPASPMSDPGGQAGFIGRGGNFQAYGPAMLRRMQDGQGSSLSPQPLPPPPGAPQQFPTLNGGPRVDPFPTGSPGAPPMPQTVNAGQFGAVQMGQLPGMAGGAPMGADPNRPGDFVGVMGPGGGAGPMDRLQQDGMARLNGGGLQGMPGGSGVDPASQQDLRPPDGAPQSGPASAAPNQGSPLARMFLPQGPMSAGQVRDRLSGMQIQGSAAPPRYSY